MKHNIINAIVNLVNHPVLTLETVKGGNNRANDMGTALEEYVKNLFGNSFNLSEIERLEKLREVFSYFGNKNNPPDMMLRDGDAIEVKKIESKGSTLALNSSYPKHTLKCSNPLITKACKEAEEWEEKDMLYIIGVVKSQRLQSLNMVYGSEYCASEETYSNIRNRIKESVINTPCVENEDTNELGHINRIDPLGITYLRVRGMWGIENPTKVFDYVYTPKRDATFNFMCIINDDKWNSLDNKEVLLKLAEEQENLCIKSVKIKNPDNPAKLCTAKLITYNIQ